MLMDEESTLQRGVSRKMSLIIGARRHLEWGHEKYIMDTIQSHPAQVSDHSGLQLYWFYFFISLIVLCSVVCIVGINKSA